MTLESVHGIFSLLAFGCLVGLFYTAWHSLVVDAVRQRMFEIRDEAFLWAYDHGHLEDPDYRRFRESANLAIRHYENVSLLKLVVLGVFFGLNKKAPEARAIFPHGSPFKERFEELTRVSVRGIVLRSLLFMIPFACLLPVIGFLSLLNHGGSLLPRKVVSTLSRELRAELLSAEI